MNNECSELGLPVSIPGFIGRLRADLRAAKWTEAYLEWLFDGNIQAALAEENVALSRHETARFAMGPAALLTRLFLLGDKLSDKEVALALPRLGVRGAQKLQLIRAVNDQGTRFRANFQLMPHRCPLEFMDLEDLKGDEFSSVDGSADQNEDPVYVDPYSLLPAGHGLTPGEGPDYPEGPGQDWWIISDLPGSLLGGQLPASHVLGVGGASRSLLRFTLRAPQQSALDMGTGCGIQALYLAQHTLHVVGTDISARALEFARFNAMLAGPKTEKRLEWRQGSFLEPVAGERFEQVVSNPPFVITPPQHREGGLMEYRDGGRSGDGVMSFLLRSLPAHLTAGGVAQLIGNWECVQGQDWQQKPRLWASQAQEEAGVSLDVTVALREQIFPREYANMWLRDEGLDVRTRRRDWEVTQKHWVNYFESRDVEAVAFGYLTLRRFEVPADGRAMPADGGAVSAGGGAVLTDGGAVLTDGTLSALTEPAVPVPVCPADLQFWALDARGSSVSATGSFVTDQLNSLAALRAFDLFDHYFTLAPDVSEQRFYTPGTDQPTVIRLLQGNGWGLAVDVDAALAGIVGAADGELTLGQISDAVASLVALEPQQMRSDMREPLLELIERGFLVLEA